MTINSGRVKFSRVRKDDDYGINRSAEVEFAFTVDEGADPEKIADGAGILAVRKVLELLELQKRKDPAPAVVNEVSGAGDKAALAAAAGAPAQAGSSPASVKAPKPPKTPKQDDKKPEPAPAASSTDEEWGALAPEITDKDLSEACSRTAKAIGGEAPTVPIRHLIAEFAGPPPKQLREIPQSTRAEFLKRLAKLAEKA